jgi:NADH:ubiquinone reductase (H+-translocating)
MTRPRVVIVGGGFGGYFAARTLARNLRDGEAQVALVSDTDGMLYQPLLPDVAVGALDPRIASNPLRQAFGAVEVRRARATAIDVQRERVTLEATAGELTLDYDYLLLAPGGITRTVDVPGLAGRAVGFKTTAEALYLRELVLGRMEAASSNPEPLRRRAAFTFVVVGAGYAGVELTAQMARLTRNLLPLFPTLTGSQIRWLLLDTASAVMPELGTDLGERALRVLHSRDVEVRLRTSVKEVDGHQVRLTDGDVVPSATVVWCAGIAANPLVTTTGLPLEKGRLVVTPYLAVEEHPNVFAIGDAAAVPDISQNGSPPPWCPPTAQHAMRQGPAAAHNILAAVRKQQANPYRHRDLGLVVDLGGPQAVARPLGVPLAGWPAKLITRSYHLLALPSSRHRLGAMAEWALAGGRPNDVSFGLVDLREALAGSAEHAPIALTASAGGA